MKDERRMTGHWEFANADGSAIQTTGDVTDTSGHICDDLRAQAKGLLGKHFINFATLTATDKADGRTVRFIGQYGRNEP